MPEGVVDEPQNVKQKGNENKNKLGGEEHEENDCEGLS